MQQQKFMDALQLIQLIPIFVREFHTEKAFTWVWPPSCMNFLSKIVPMRIPSNLGHKLFGEDLLSAAVNPKSTNRDLPLEE